MCDQDMGWDIYKYIYIYIYFFFVTAIWANGV